jgi:UDP-2,3-diacylglucosamine pyrophosphatase LpxH
MKKEPTMPSGEFLEADLIVEREDCNLVIISDLHVGEGYLQAQRAYSRAERFFSDAAFCNFLKKIHQENIENAGAATPKPLKLIINGDFLDFVRARSVPDERERRLFRRYFCRLGLMRREEDFEIGPKESRYGLKTEPHKSVWKLHRICQGHPLVFAALAEFVAGGNRLVIIKGNHDLEFFWQAVQDEFVRLLAAQWPSEPDRPNSARQRYLRLRPLVEFCQRAYIVENQLYIEHGHQYQPITSVAKPLLNERELCLPPGSILNRYLVNAIDHLAPVVTYIRGTFEVFYALVAGHRWRALRLLIRHFPMATRMLLRGHRRVAFTLFLEILPYLFAVFYASFGIFLPLVWKAYSHALIQFTGSAGEFLISRWFLNFMLGLGLFGLFQFFASFLSGRNLAFRFKKAFATAKERMQRADLKDGEVDRTSENRWRDAISRAQQKMRKFLILGHTHQPVVQSLEDNWWYINTGAWIPVIERGGHHPIREKITLTFVYFMRRANGMFDFDLRYWNDDKGRSERLVVWEKA